MSQWILYVATSLDGFIARENGALDWLPPPDEESYEAFWQGIDATVMGGTTYEQVLSFGEWPYEGKPSYVLTRQTRQTDRPDVHFVATVTDVQDQITAAGYERVWVIGGGQLVSALVQQGLIDVFVIALIPVILGRGIPLYRDWPETPLHWVSSQVVGEMVEVTWVRA
ncbi:MAG: dihydrofolate reductase family protein [Synechococcales cyanobacterium]